MMLVIKNLSKYISLTINGYGFSDIKEKRNYRFDLPCPLI